MLAAVTTPARAMFSVVRRSLARFTFAPRKAPTPIVAAEPNRNHFNRVSISREGSGPRCGDFAPRSEACRPRPPTDQLAARSLRRQSGWRRAIRLVRSGPMHAGCHHSSTICMPILGNGPPPAAHADGAYLCLPRIRSMRPRRSPISDSSPCSPGRYRVASIASSGRCCCGTPPSGSLCG